MKCPECGADTEVKDSRPTGSGAIKRRRWCKQGHRYTTLETPLGSERPRDVRVLRDTPEGKIARRLRRAPLEREPWAEDSKPTDRMGVIAAAAKRAAEQRARGERRRAIEARRDERELLGEDPLA